MRKVSFETEVLGFEESDVHFCEETRTANQQATVGRRKTKS